eukprot:GEMP01017640.1.p1 GENE.GEMP01017640.1~~GEMP01017640.1.p1  ORF type:complete len:287 (+),score=51.70 GEMP01017640.1:22-861(+)
MGSQSSRGQTYPRHLVNSHETGLIGQHRSGSSHQLTAVDRDNADTVPVVFTWAQGAQDVRLCIEAYGWREIPMSRSGIDFHIVYELPRGKHRYKFLVDGEYQFAPDQLVDTLAECGTEETVNVIDLQDFDKNAFLEDPASWGPSDADLVYTQMLPDISEYTADAPHVPSLLNKSPYICVDPPPKSLPPNVPLHCICGHVYHDAGTTLRPFGLPVVLTATTHRYERKYSTTIFVRRSSAGGFALESSGAPPKSEVVNPLRLCMRKMKPTPNSPEKSVEVT